MSNHSFYPFLREGAVAPRRDSDSAASGVKRSSHPVVFPSSPAQTSSSTSQSSVLNSPSLSSVSTNITTPSPSPKPGISTPTPTRTPRIPALTGKGARRPLPNGETLTASQVAIPVAPPSLHNPSALDAHLSTRFRSSVSVSAGSVASQPYVEEEKPTTPVSRGLFGHHASHSSSRQHMSFATPQVPSNSPLPPPPSYSSLPLPLPPPPSPSPSPPPPLMNPTSPPPQPELEPMTKEDELIAECMQPSIPQPTTHGVWRIPKEEIPANCHRTHPDSKKNRRIWSTEQQLKLVDKGYKADITIVSNIFMRDGYIIDWKTRLPVYPHTLELATEQSRRSTRKRHEPHRLGDEAPPPVKKKKTSDGFNVNPHNPLGQTQPVQKARPGRPRKTSKEHAASTDPPAPVDGRSLTAELSLQYPIDDVHAPSPSQPRQKAKRGRRSQVEQLHASLGDHLADSTLLSLRTDDLPPGRITRSRSKQLSETRLTAEPQPPSAQSSDYGEDEEMVERMLELTGSPSESSADEGPENGLNRSPPSSDDDMYLSLSEHARIYSRGAVEPPDPPRRPQEGSSRAQDMRIAIPTFVYRDRHQDKNP